MPDDPFYSTQRWRKLRVTRLRMDAYRCAVPGCATPALIVDHIIPRYRGGSDTMNNLRSLCRKHDNEIKERPGRSERGHGGEFTSPCDLDGRPLDPAHPWYKKA